MSYALGINPGCPDTVGVQTTTAIAAMRKAERGLHPIKGQMHNTCRTDPGKPQHFVPRRIVIFAS
jgi:hypothetical protein